MSKANDRELAGQRKVLEKVCEEKGLDTRLAMLGYDLGAHAAFRLAVKLIAQRDRMKALHECGRLLKQSIRAKT